MEEIYNEIRKITLFNKGKIRFVMIAQLCILKHLYKWYRNLSVTYTDCKALRVSNLKKKSNKMNKYASTSVRRCSPKAYKVMIIEYAYQTRFYILLSFHVKNIAFFFPTILILIVLYHIYWILFFNIYYEVEAKVSARKFC